MLKKLVLASVVFSSPLYAQQPNLQQLEEQRTQAFAAYTMAAARAAEAKVMILEQENAKLRAELDELKKKVAEVK